MSLINAKPSSPFTCLSWFFLLVGCHFAASVFAAETLDFTGRLGAIAPESRFQDAGYFVWGGSGIRGEDGKYYLFYARWKTGSQDRVPGDEQLFKDMKGWMKYSEIAAAVSDSPTGPFRYLATVLRGTGDTSRWDCFNAHSPHVQRFGGKICLYFIANNLVPHQDRWMQYADGQRIGVAVADSVRALVAGRFQRSAQPLMAPDGTNTFCRAVNPSVTQGRDGRYLMMFKSRSAPTGGFMTQWIAAADQPDGPFQLAGPALTEARYDAEDPYFWFDRERDRYYAIVKDFSRKERALSPQFGALALITSEKGWGDWHPAAHNLVSLREFTDTAGQQHSLANLECPQLLFDEQGQPICLYAAAGEQDPFQGTPSFNLATPLLKPAAAAPTRPDILLIMPDQMRGDCLSILGHPAVRTPQLDELSRQGALFRRAYTTVPSCIPARYALLTGLFPQTSGVVGFQAKPFATAPLPERFSRAGYATVLVGRNMHQVPASELGYQKQILGSTYVEDDAYDTFLKQAAPETGGIKNLVGRQLGISYNTSSAKPWPLAENLHPTAWVVSESRQAISATAANQPLFLTASFYAPHPPLFPPKRYFDAYLQKKLPAPAHGDWVDWKALSPKGNKAGDRILLAGDALRNDQAGYFGLIEQLDSEIAKLIADFKARSAQAGRPWLIVVTSDHGEMLGDHGYFRKCEPYEGSANIPFIIAGSPELGFQPGLRCNQPVCLEDIMPTLLQLAGIAPPAGIDGVNLVPTLRGDNPIIREWLHFEHAPCYSPEQSFHALTDGHFKYLWRPTHGAEQLFDLQNDPKEEHDLSTSPAARDTLEKWRTRLIQRLASRPEGFSDGKKLMPGRPYKALNAGVKK